MLFRSNYDPLVESGQMTLLEGGEQILPGITVETFPGHTASMQAILVNGDRPEEPAFAGQGPRRTACYISDLIPTTAHIDLTWGMSFDLYPLDTIASKKRYYARAIPQKWVTVFTHDPQTPWASLEPDESGKIIAKGVE